LKWSGTYLTHCSDYEALGYTAAPTQPLHHAELPEGHRPFARLISKAVFNRQLGRRELDSSG